MSRAARGVVPTHRLARGIVAAALVAAVLGGILTVVNVSFFGIILAYLAGIGIGETAKRASGGYRDPVLGRGAATSAAIGFLALPVLGVIAAGTGGVGLAWAAIAWASSAIARRTASCA